MKGVLIIAHGSRAKETESDLKAVVDMAAEKVTDVCIEYAFMQLSDRTIESGIAALAEKKVTEIKIVPYFLFMGVHMKEDIPNAAGKYMKNYPGIKMVIGEPIGNDKQRLSEILADRIRN